MKRSIRKNLESPTTQSLLNSYDIGILTIMIKKNISQNRKKSFIVKEVIKLSNKCIF